MNSNPDHRSLRIPRWLWALLLLILLAGGIRAEDPKTPLPFAPVVKYFAKATSVRPLRLHDQCVLFALSEPISAQDHNECLIVVTADPNRLAVSFLVSGGFGMNFVREFFESPFFGAEETEAFYRLLETPPGSATFHSERFSVEITRAETPEWMFLSFSFGPRSSTTPNRTPLTPLPQP